METITPDSPDQSSETRRDFIKQATLIAGAAAALAACSTTSMDNDTDVTAIGAGADAGAPGPQPWYRRCLRWGQTNITEADVPHYDIPWWRQHWKRTQVQGIIVNAGGIFAYYPSKFPLHHRAATLNGRDLFGELRAAAREENIAVVARMDSSKVHAEMFAAHPDWIAVDSGGQPYRSGEFYLTCINSAYYEEFLPDVMREIIDRTHPEGFADNIWSSLERNQICYCQNCQKRFMDYGGLPLPARTNWDDPSYRKWIDFSYLARTQLWDLNNKVTRDAGGPHCLWVGMNGAGPSGQGHSFRDLKAICQRAEIILLDAQSRSNTTGFAQNALEGKLVHSLLSADGRHDKIMPESMAMYQHGAPQFRLSAKTAPEARLWMLSGFAGGIQPWWHHVGAYDEDRRPYRTAEPIMRWHRANQHYLINRKPIATVALAWSQRNTDFFGRDNAEAVVEQPFRGFANALTRARIPFIPLCLDNLDRDAADFSVLILPNIGAMTDEHIAAIRRFVARGGSIVATGQTSLCNQFGDPKPALALADLFGITGIPTAAVTNTPRAGAGPGAGAAVQHTYLRLTPELRAQFYGPKQGDEPTIDSRDPTNMQALINSTRHPILTGLDDTDILPYGGPPLAPLTVAPNFYTLATFIPAFPATPPEISYMRTRATTIPALIINGPYNPFGSEAISHTPPPARIAYFPADLDRRFALDNFPDHADILANAVRWAARDTIPLKVQGPGLLNIELYHQPATGQDPARLIFHVLNFSNAGSWRSPVHELIPIGPLQISIKIPEGFRPRTVRTMVALDPLTAANVNAGWIKLELRSILDHEMVVIEG